GPYRRACPGYRAGDISGAVAAPLRAICQRQGDRPWPRPGGVTAHCRSPRRQLVGRQLSRRRRLFHAPPAGAASGHARHAGCRITGCSPGPGGIGPDRLTMPTLLVIDDEPSILHAFRRAFREPDVKLVTAATAADGLDAVARCQPDVV